MFKVKVWHPHEGVVIENGEQIRRKCLRGEDVYLPELNLDDIENNLYIPYKVKVLGADGKPAQRQRVEPKTATLKSVNSNMAGIVSMSDNVVDSIQGLLGPKNGNRNIDRSDDKSKVVSPEGVSDDLCIEEGQEVLEPFSQEDYVNQHNQMHNAIVNSMSEGIGEDREVIKMSTVKPKMPVFAEGNSVAPIILGTLNVEDQNKMPGEKDIFDKRPLIVDLVKDEKGGIDVIKSLGMKVVDRGEF